MNTIKINFVECDPVPDGGYIVKWRVRGSGDPYTEEGPFFSSPAIFIDGVNPAGTCYEGIMQTDCTQSGESGQTLGSEIPWLSDCEESGANDYTIELAAPCAGIYSNYIIDGGIAGDVVIVKAQYSGTLLRYTEDFVRADLSINSPNGTYDQTSSACYSGLGALPPHPFSISVQTTITMAGPTEVVTLKAVSHNSVAIGHAVIVTIIDVNGVAKNIFVEGCSGIEVTPGDC